MDTTEPACTVDFGCRIEIARRMVDAINGWAHTLALAREMGASKNAEATEKYREQLEIRIATWLRADNELRDRYGIDDDGPVVQLPNRTSSSGAFFLLNMVSKNMDKVCEITMCDLRWPAFSWTILSQKTARKLQGNGVTLQGFIEGAEQFRQNLDRYNRDFMKQELLARAARHIESLPMVTVQQLERRFDAEAKAIRRRLKENSVVPLIQGGPGKPDRYAATDAERVCRLFFEEKVR